MKNVLSDMDGEKYTIVKCGVQVPINKIEKILSASNLKLATRTPDNSRYDAFYVAYVLPDDNEKISGKEELHALSTTFNCLNKNKKAIVVGAGAILGLTIIGAVSYGVYTHYCRKKMLSITNNLTVALKKYIAEIKNNNVTYETKAALNNAIDTAKKIKDYQKIQIALSIDEINVLIHALYNVDTVSAVTDDIQLSEVGNSDIIDILQLGLSIPIADVPA